jgi:hypothetical protein
MSSDYAILLLFAAANLVAPFYRRSFTIDVVAYLATLIFLYVSFLFWSIFCKISIVFYCITSFYFLSKMRLRILYCAFANLFICQVIPHTAGSAGGLELSMFFDADPDPRLLNTIGDTAIIAGFCLTIGVPIFLIVKLFTSFCRRRVREYR